MGLLIAGCNQPVASSPRAEQPDLVSVQETFTLSEGDSWVFRTPSLWKVAGEGTARFLQMAEPPARPILPGVPRPQEYAIYRPYEFRSFNLSCFVRVDCDLSRATRDACIIFGRRDDTHFYYVHLSALGDHLHNTIVRVDGDTRKRIVPEHVRPAPVMTDRKWHKLDLLRDCNSGGIQVFVDAVDPKAAPYFDVTDRTYEWGFVGLGSFDDNASFTRILIEGEGRKPLTPPEAEVAAK
jgi:hypothetical protein